MNTYTDKDHQTVPVVGMMFYSSAKIDYKIGDVIESKSEDIKGTCTGFCHGNTCVMIDGKVYGGKQYFRKAITE